MKDAMRGFKKVILLGMNSDMPMEMQAVSTKGMRLAINLACLMEMQVLLTVCRQ